MRAPTSSRSVDDRLAPPSAVARASSSEKNGLPAAVSCTERSVGRGNERPTPLLDDRVHVLQAERSKSKLGVAGEHLLGRERKPTTRLLAQRKQEADALGQPAGREEESACGRAVEPLEIVDGDDDEPRLRKHAQHAEEPQRHGALVDGRSGRHLEQERGAQRLRLGRRQLLERVMRRREKVADAGVGELRLRLERARSEERAALGLSALGSGAPQRRLAHACLAGDEQRPRPRLAVEEACDHCELRVPADDRLRHVPIVAHALLR